VKNFSTLLLLQSNLATYEIVTGNLLYTFDYIGFLLIVERFIIKNY